MKTNFVGKVCACKRGRLGYVTAQRRDSEEVWIGVSLDGRGLWQSTMPTIVFSSLDSYIGYLKGLKGKYEV